jgi:murein DD-endopeptidase MepM/ murein hydrolase activator NlpD
LRSQFTITITDYRGARHFALKQVVKRFALTLAVILLGTLLLGATAIVWLKRQVAELETRREIIADLNRQLQDYNHALRSAIEGKGGELKRTYIELEKVKHRLGQANEELEQVNDNLEDIEVMIGLRPDPEMAIGTRLDTASQTARERALMLQNIPSGPPLRESHVTSDFGWRNLGGKKQFHAGLDLRAAMGTPVYATADALVETAGITKGNGFGNMVVLLHNYGFRTYYGHLDEILVKKGQYVRKGEPVGLSGASGRATAPHLHYEVRHLKNTLDPLFFVEWSLEDYDSLFEKETRVQWDSLAVLIKESPGNGGQLSSLRDHESKAN